MTNRSNKLKITKEDVQSAIRRLKRRKNYTKDSDITITTIAKEIGCSRNTLYRKEFEVILGPFHRIRKSSKKEAHPKGSIEYYKDILKTRDMEIIKLEKNLTKAKDGLMDLDSMARELNNLKPKLKKLQEKVSNMYDPKQVETLASENAKLRELLLRNGLKVQI